MLKVGPGMQTLWLLAGPSANICSEYPFESQKNHLSETILIEMDTLSTPNIWFLSDLGVTKALTSMPISAQSGQSLQFQHTISKTCVKLSLSERLKLILKTNYRLMQSKILQNAPKRAFCNTLDLH